VLFELGRKVIYTIGQMCIVFSSEAIKPEIKKQNMKTEKKIIELFRAIKASSPFASRNFKWEVGDLDDMIPWSSAISNGIIVGQKIDCYIYRNEGDVSNPDWSWVNNYIVTITSPMSAIIKTADGITFNFNI